MTIYNWLCLFGAPTIISAVGAFLLAKIKRIKVEQEAIKLGLQALLRANMISEYNKWKEKGGCPIYAKENFENMWEQYHSLGANGVMDGIHNEFMSLPIV